MVLAQLVGATFKVVYNVVAAGRLNLGEVQYYLGRLHQIQDLADGLDMMEYIMLDTLITNVKKGVMDRLE